jgi:2-succinyl-5-enolpyruvyl-6-hydroxy-3-cyclohexene-1-carboxylate synthase
MLLTKSTSSSEVVGNRGAAGCDGAVALLVGLYTANVGSAGRATAVVVVVVVAAASEDSAATFIVLPKLYEDRAQTSKM